MSDHITVLSLGWGVQSFTLLAMSSVGELSPLDAAIHADTRHERTDTYMFAASWASYFAERGPDILTVGPDDGGRVLRRPDVAIPAYTDAGGMIPRQCTSMWKVAPIRRETRRLMREHGVKNAEMWMGISLDEWQRMRKPDVAYLQYRYPLVEKRMTRGDCIGWLQTHNFAVPLRSACVFCPFQSDQDWQAVMSDDQDRAEAIRVDAEMRDAMLPGKLYLHRSCKPLQDVDFRSIDERNGQLSLFSDECHGVCGV